PKAKGPPRRMALSHSVQSTSVVVIVVIVVTMIMVMVIMIMIVMVLFAVDVVFVVLDELAELFAAHGLVGRLAEAGDVVDDLVLEDRGAELRERLRRLAIIVVDLLFLAREAADLGDQRLLVLVVGDLDLVLVADFGDDQPEADAALGDLAILLARLF